MATKQNANKKDLGQLKLTCKHCGKEIVKCDWYGDKDHKIVVPECKGFIHMRIEDPYHYCEQITAEPKEAE
jgi:hypothetical protein